MSPPTNGTPKRTFDLNIVRVLREDKLDAALLVAISAKIGVKLSAV